MATIWLPIAENSAPIKQIIVTCVRILTGVILLTAGVAKVTGFDVFVTQVALYDILPMSLVRLASYCLLSAEITIGFVLIVGYFSRGASILSVSLFTTFIGALSLALWRELPLEDCGCQNFLFSLFNWDVSLSWTVVFIDTLLLAGSLLVANTDSGGYGVDFFVYKRTDSEGNDATDTDH